MDTRFVKLIRWGAASDSSLRELNEAAARNIYTKLQDRQIRLVQIHPRNTNEISCSLIHTGLDDAPAFEALSYVWGQQTNLQKIRLDGKRFFVTENLYKALKRLRLPDENRLIWVDALAINQSDLPERNAQVQIMKEIYSQAHNTLIWLHQPRNRYFNADLWNELCLRDRSENFDHLSPLHSRALGAGDIHFQELPRCSNNIPPGSARVALDRSLLPLDPSRRPLDEVLKQVLRQLCKQPYWSRIWTTQEVRHSGQATLVTEDGTTPFGSLLDLADLAEREINRGKLVDDTQLRVQLYLFQKICLGVLPRHLRNDRPFDFLDLAAWMEFCSWKECSDPRDMVFGFRSWLPPAIQHEISINDSLTPEQVLAICKMNFIRTSDRLEFLGHSNLFGSISYADLPSWDPENYIRNRENGILSEMHLMRVLPEIGDLNQKPGWGQQSFRDISDDARILHVKGQWLGQITLVSKEFRSNVTLVTDLLLQYYAGCMEALEVKAEEVDDLALVLQPHRRTRFRDLSHVLIHMRENKLTGQNELVSKVKEFRDHRQQLKGGFQMEMLFKSSTLVRLQTMGMNRDIFGMTWIRKSRPGDKVCLVQGCSRALILRPGERRSGQCQVYKLIGSIFFPGHVDGRSHIVNDMLGTTSIDDIYLC